MTETRTPPRTAEIRVNVWIIYSRLLGSDVWDKWREYSTSEEAITALKNYRKAYSSVYEARIMHECRVTTMTELIVE
jgi:hypothetical protein